MECISIQRRQRLRRFQDYEIMDSKGGSDVFLESLIVGRFPDKNQEGFKVDSS